MESEPLLSCGRVGSQIIYQEVSKVWPLAQDSPENSDNACIDISKCS